ncbi:MAG: FliH/SctL family protein [Myxococcota bacterium]
MITVSTDDPKRRPAEIVPWAKIDPSAETKALPSWLVRPADDSPSPHSAPPTSRAVTSKRVVDEEAELYERATHSALPPLTPPPAPAIEVAGQAEIQEAQRQLAAVLDEAENHRRQVLESSERHVTELALAIAERIVGRELRTDPAIVSSWVHQGIGALHGEDILHIRVSTDVAQALEGSSLRVPVETDPSLPAYSCRIHGRQGRVDAGLRARLEAMAEALGIDWSAGEDDAH